MARARNIKPGFFTNDQLAECPMATRLLFIGLWTIADREGRIEDRPKKIKMEVFPADDVDVEAALDDLAGRGFLVRYCVAGVRYVEIVNWHRHQNPHQREAQSVIPGPDQSDATPPPDAPKAQPRLVQGTAKDMPEHRQDSRIPDSGFSDSGFADTGLPHPAPARKATLAARRKAAVLERSPEEAAVLAVLSRVSGFPPDVGDDTTEKLREYAADFADVDLLEVAKALRDKGSGVKNGWSTYRNWLKSERENGARRARADPVPFRAPYRNGNGFLAALERDYGKDRTDGPSDPPEAIDAAFVVGPAPRRQQPGGH